MCGEYQLGQCHIHTALHCLQITRSTGLVMHIIPGCVILSMGYQAYAHNPIGPDPRYIILHLTIIAIQIGRYMSFNHQEKMEVFPG